MKAERITLINQNGSVITIPKRSWEMLTPKNKAKFQLLADPVKIEIPIEVKEFLNPGIPEPEVDKEQEIQESEVQETPVTEEEPLDEIPKDHPINNPELAKKMQEYNQEVIPIPKIEKLKENPKKPHPIAEIQRLRKELKEMGVTTYKNMKLTELKKLYNDTKKQKNRKV